MASGLSNIRTLVVDDVTSARRVVILILREIGLSLIEEARSSSEALDKLKSDNFHLIISDWEMPDIPGLELCKQVRELANYKDTPFIMVTSAGEKERVIEALQAGVSDYAVKPVSLAVLADKIKRAFSSLSSA